MRTELSDEALEYGRLAQRALEAAGDDVAAARALAELGAWDLAPRESADELEAAAALCRAAGWWARPDPVAGRLSRPADITADGLVVVADGAPAVPPGVDPGWVAVTLDGRRSRVTAVDPLVLEPLDDPSSGAADVALGLTLPCWTLLGMLDRAVDLTRAYVNERQQFGQPLASFQGVQFQLTDAEVERVGVEELAKYALWSLTARPDDAVADALALRLAAVEAAEVVFRVAHQLHGAIGFCDETTLSWLSRASQPLRRLPLGLSATRDELTRRVGRRGLSGLFDPV